MSVLRINYDDRPEDILGNITDALSQLGVQVNIIESEGGAGWMEYEVTLIGGCYGNSTYSTESAREERSAEEDC